MTGVPGQPGLAIVHGAAAGSAAMTTTAGVSRTIETRPWECVSLVHGFLAHSLMMNVLGHRLDRRGYLAKPWGYWNMRRSILEHAEAFSRELASLDADRAVGTIHLVTHSMGGIIARAALERYRPRKLGRFVMLAPPNRGSFVATAMAGLIGGMLKPVAELTTAPDSLVNSLGMPLGIDVGVIAASRDALVAPESTRPDVPHAHVTIPCLHSSLLFRRDAADLVAAFLASGAFPQPANRV
jgi:pimeloyl-ACP methyl ester carboxylesterase